MKSVVSGISAFHKTAMLVLEPGEELHASVVRFCTVQEIHGGYLSAVGAIDDVELGYFRLPEKVYDRRRISERLEVVSLHGNIALKDGKPFLHAHGLFTGADFQAVGGHVFSARTSITLEVSILQFGKLSREPYPEFGLTRISASCGG
jgi:predicted DNA-binding protein with PD1-like motif